MTVQHTPQVVTMSVHELAQRILVELREIEINSGELYYKPPMRAADREWRVQLIRGHVARAEKLTAAIERWAADPETDDAA